MQSFVIPQKKPFSRKKLLLQEVLVVNFLPEKKLFSKKSLSFWKCMLFTSRKEMFSKKEFYFRKFKLFTPGKEVKKAVFQTLKNVVRYFRNKS